VSNGSFESTTQSEIPEGWSISPATIIDHKATGKAAMGESFLALQGAKESLGVIDANVAILPAFLGRDLRITAYGKSPDAKKALSLSLRCEIAGKDTRISTKPWPKTKNQWEKVEFVAAVPSSADPNSVRLRALLPKGAGSGYALDGVKVVIDLLGDHADLGETDKAGHPVGWTANPQDILVSSKELPAATNGHAVALAAPKDTWGLLARKMKLDSADLGKTIVVAATGYAEAGNNLRLAVRGKVGEETVDLASEFWPATEGAWKLNALKVKLPENLDPDSVFVRILLRQGGEGLYGVSQVEAGQ
jgi:hypothetical protein